MSPFRDTDFGRMGKNFKCTVYFCLKLGLNERIEVLNDAYLLQVILA